MALGCQQLLIVLIIVLVLFGGRGRISSLMGDMASGIKSFRKGLKDDDEDTTSKSEAAPEVTQASPGTTTASETSKKTEA